jgi:HK97 family phage prohead protease
MMERRFVPGAEIRAKDDGHIEGHAAVFDQEYVLWDSASYRVVEIVKPGTFKRALKEKQDVRALYNHDANQVLGRTAAKTLAMKEDDQGLYFDCAPPDTQIGRDVVTLVKRGDISGCSFAFNVTGQTVTEKTVGDKTIRTREINDVDLYDVGPVTYPAYSGTDVNARMIESRAEMFPQGVPANVLALLPELRSASERASVGGGSDCECDCPECQVGDCENCSASGCEDKNCDHTAGDDDRAAAVAHIDHRLQQIR